MAAPSGTIWGSVVGSGSGQGRIGVYITSSSTKTVTTITMQVWFWSKYGVRDSSNTFHYSLTGTGVVTIGSVNINHSVSTGSGWSTSNQTRIGTYSKSYGRTTSDQLISCAADFSGIEAISGSGSVSTTYSVPALNRYSVSYNANGGSGAPATHYYYYGQSTNLSMTIPVRTGYRFLGWSLQSTATSPSYSAGQSWSGYNEGNYVLYAVWERVAIVVTFDAGYNGGTVEGVDEIEKSYSYGDRLGELPIAVRKNYKFLGWFTEPDGTGFMIYDNTVITSSIRYYAMFELQANCFIKVDGTYKTGMMYVKKTDGAYKTGVVSVRANGTYKETNM